MSIGRVRRRTSLFDRLEEELKIQIRVIADCYTWSDWMIRSVSGWILLLIEHYFLGRIRKNGRRRLCLDQASRLSQNATTFVLDFLQNQGTAFHGKI